MPDYSTFEERLNLLQSVVGNSQVEGSVTYDQPYAAVQHENESYIHPRGGQSHYLSAALMNDVDEIYKQVAEGLLDGATVIKMAEAMEMMASHASALAPILTGRLRASANPRVTVGGNEVYNRPAMAPRYENVRTSTRKGNGHHSVPGLSKWRPR